MLLLTSLVAALIAPFVLPAPAPSSSTGPPPGYSSVKDSCSTPEVLYCCNGTGAGGVAGEPTYTATGCMRHQSHSRLLPSRLEEANGNSLL